MQTTSDAWKQRLRTLLSGKETLTPEERNSLRNELLGAAFARDVQSPASTSSIGTTRSFLQSVHRTGLGYLLSAGLAAAVAIFVVRPTSGKILPEEVATLHHANQFPADFEIGGEPQRLESEFQRVLAQRPQSSDRVSRPVAAQDGQPRSMPPLPKELRKDVELGAGRFVSWRGKPGVSLRLRNAVSAPPPSLVIVSLDDEDDPVFASEKQVEELRDAGLQPARITTWRENGFGYALYEPGR